MNSDFTILIIDDEEEICILLAHVLRKAGYNVIYAHDLEEGNSKFKEASPNLVFLDLHLPDGSGLTLLPEIKKKQGLKVIVISAYLTEKETALNSGADAFIGKPFSFQNIMDTVEVLIESK